MDAVHKRMRIAVSRNRFVLQPNQKQQRVRNPSEAYCLGPSQLKSATVLMRFANIMASVNRDLAYSLVSMFYRSYHVKQGEETVCLDAPQSFTAPLLHCRL
jgi:hypothetical protein